MPHTSCRYYPEALLQQHLQTHLVAAGAQEADANATTRALLHASRIGVDSHGVRLIGHYMRLLRSGGINPRPKLTYQRTAPATGHINADSGLGHPAAYRAMTEAITLAKETGIGAVSVCRSTHFGAAGAYALTAAEQGFIGIIMSNSDAAVALFHGAAAFHGTNPLAMAAPVEGCMPWLLDMATSSIPFNRVKLYRTLGLTLPENGAVDSHGRPTQNPQEAAFLQPLGGEGFGFKGAALAGVITILSAVMTGADLDPCMMSTDAPQTDTSRQNVGHFAIALDPERFVSRAVYHTAMTRYLTLLRQSPTADPHHPSLAPGDREWQEARHRTITGIPVDAETCALLGLS